MGVGQWLLEWAVLCLEPFGVAELYMGFCCLVKPNTRALTAHETKLLQSIFANGLNPMLVRIDEGAKIGCQHGSFAYVSFWHINSWGTMHDAHFIHEVSHVWQYERVGARYIVWALQAQATKAGYNYGFGYASGIDALHQNRERGLRAFNLEQQADIIADAFRTKSGDTPVWSTAAADMALFAPYLHELRV